MSRYEDLKLELLNTYESINCYEEVPEVLSELRTRKISTAILSNASPSMLSKAVKNSKIDEYIDSSFSADSLKIYKPYPSAYNLVIDNFLPLTLLKI